MLITGDANESIEIADAATERPLVGAPRADVWLSIRVLYHEFSGAIHAWIWREQWDGFLEAIRELERTRTGFARLQGMSPGGLELTFRIANPRGSLFIEGTIGKIGLHVASLQFGPMELDAGMLADYVKQLEAI
jgi:hypothetical protein